MKTDYSQRLLPVIRHLEEHFNQPMNLDEVAQLACLSPYHFHRIFRATVGETLNDYLRRLRLEGAAHDLFYHKPSVTQVALDYGFSSSQSLAKAFKKHFNLTPSQLRECPSIEEFADLLRNSKIGHSLRKTGHARSTTSTYDEKEPTLWSHKMEIQSFDAGHLAFIRVTGPYGQDYEPAAEKLYAWAEPNGLAQQPCIFIYHDNPELTPADKCRTDICILLDKPIDTPAGIEVKPFTGGKYAVMRQAVTNASQYSQAWDAIMSQVVEQGLEVDERPCFELYHHYDLDTGHADVSFCSAIA